MSTAASRRKIYRRARTNTGLSEVEWGRLFTLGGEGGQHEVRKKERDPALKSSRGVSMSDALAASLLSYLDNNGKEIKDIQFDRQGNIIDIPDKQR